MSDCLRKSSVPSAMPAAGRDGRGTAAVSVPGTVPEPCIVPGSPVAIDVYGAPALSKSVQAHRPEYHAIQTRQPPAPRPDTADPYACHRPIPPYHPYRPCPPPPHPSEPCVINTAMKNIDVVGVGEVDVTRHDEFMSSTFEVKVDLSRKADKTYVDAALSRKADKSYVDGKADKTYVDSRLAEKADKTYVDASLVRKADKAYVDASLVRKADKTYVDASLAGKVDREQGKGLSTNDFTDELKSRLESIENLPPAEGGAENTLVTTGDKWTWDAKQDAISYYLENAEVTETSGLSTLTLTGSDGAKTVFSVVGGTGVIASISADGTALPVTDRNVDIPLASTETPGEYGNAGLVRCMFEEFS